MRLIVARGTFPLSFCLVQVILEKGLEESHVLLFSFHLAVSKVCFHKVQAAIKHTLHREEKPFVIRQEVSVCSSMYLSENCLDNLRSTAVLVGVSWAAYKVIGLTNPVHKLGVEDEDSFEMEVPIKHVLIDFDKTRIQISRIIRNMSHESAAQMLWEILNYGNLGKKFVD